ncbi:MAG: mechanosensitive ion channel [Bdellovibrionaceae bacterium]|nr:mechanosensitive ion channel [Pseudobdellovibrionaceae bacterium]
MDSYIKPEYIEKLIHDLVLFLPRIPIAIILFAVGLFVIRIILKTFKFALIRRGVEVTLANFLTSIASILLKILLIITVASTVGIATTSFVAMIGAAGLAIGLALQGSLSNFAGSVLLMVFKPYKVGDSIVAQGQEGEVKDINVFNTVLITADNRRVVIPNGPLAGGVIVNVTAENARRIEIKVGVGYGSDIEKVKKIMLDLALADQRVLLKPAPPFVGIQNFGDNSVDLVFRIWVGAVDYWSTYYSMMEQIKIAFEKEGIDIPYPQRVVHQARP